MFTVMQGVSVLDTHANIVVNPVNCVGVCGNGLALHFRNTFYNNYIQYREACFNNKVYIGKVFITYNNNADGLAICNFPTKLHWKNPSKIEYIIKGLNDLKCYLQAGDTIAIPLIGCGKGKLKSYDVIPLIRDIIGTIDDVEVLLCCEKYNSLADLL